MGIVSSKTVPRTRAQIARSHEVRPAIGVSYMHRRLNDQVLENVVKDATFWGVHLFISSEIFRVLKTPYAWTRFCKRLTAHFHEDFAHRLVQEREADVGGSENVYWQHYLESVSYMLNVQITSSIRIGAVGPGGDGRPYNTFDVYLSSDDDSFGIKRIPNGHADDVVRLFKETLEEAQALWEDSISERNSALALALAGKGGHQALDFFAQHQFGGEREACRPSHEHPRRPVTKKLCPHEYRSSSYS